MSVLFSELLVPGWAESGEKIGLGDITGTYGNPIANALPCHGAEPETFFSDAEADIKAAKALVVSVQCEPSVYLARSHVRNQLVFGVANYSKMVLLFRQSAKLVAHASLLN